MNPLIYTPDISSIAMPMTMVVADWICFFQKLMKLDTYAPMITILYYYEIVHGLALDVPSSPFKSLYYDSAIEIAADDRYPAFEAAVESGFFVKGIDLIANAAMACDDHIESYVAVVHKVATTGHFLNDQLTDAIRDKIYAIDKDAAAFIKNCRVASKGNSPTCCDPKDWNEYIEGMLRTDSCAAASILNYYLHYTAGQTLYFFCPLGCDLYDHIGKKMAEDADVLKAAVDVGLMASAISSHFYAALDVVENWNYLLEGTRFLLKSELLKCFIPFANRVVAEGLMAEFGEVNYADLNEDEWYKRNRELRDLLNSGEYRGY